MQKNYLKNLQWCFFFFDHVAGWGSATLPKMYSLARFSLRFVVIYQNFEIFYEIFFPRKTFRLWVLTIVRFSKYLFQQKLYIQGRTLKGLRKSMTFSISSGSLVAIQQTLQFTFRAAEAYSEPFQMSKMELFVKKIKGFQLLASLAKSFISNVYRDLNTLPSS